MSVNQSPIIYMQSWTMNSDKNFYEKLNEAHTPQPEKLAYSLRFYLYVVPEWRWHLTSEIEL